MGFRASQEYQCCPELGRPTPLLPRRDAFLSAARYIFTRASRRIGVLLDYQSHGSVPAVSVTTPSNMTASVDAPFAVLANSLGSWRRAPEQQCLADVPR